MTDVLFQDVAYAATGSTTKRDSKARAADIINVKDFGAVGDGSHDDTTAIQAAINAAMASGTTSGGAAVGATVFFPPGHYHVTAPLLGTAVTGSSVCLIGSGRYNTMISGSFAGYIIQHDDAVGVPCPFVNIEKMSIKNGNNAAGSGGIKVSYWPQGVIRDCYVQGFNGIDASRDAFNGLIENCGIQSPFAAGTSGTVGIYAGQTTVVCCSGNGWDVGLQVGGSTATGGGEIDGGVVGFVCIGSRFETCNTGILIGKNALGNISQSAGFIAGLSTERCNTSIYLYSAAGVTLMDVSLAGTVDVAGTGVPSYGLRVGTVDQLTCINAVVGVNASVANIDLNGSGGTSHTFIGCKGGGASTGGGGVGWNMPAAAGKSENIFINCDNPALAMSFADLPGQSGVHLTPAIEGMEYDIADSNTATWGATAAGSGSNHVKVRYNGTNWTVVGK